MLSSPDEKPKITRQLLLRVLQYAAPYRWHLVGMLLMILSSAGLSLITPLVLRDLIDHTIPQKDLPRLGMLALVLLLLPAVNGLINVIQRRLNATVGEGVIFDLRVALFSHLQRMSLRFFTHTKVGELMSRLNNDVVGAQNAISNTIVNIVTNLIQAAVLAAVMLSLEWRLTIVSVLILPLFFLAARRLADTLREIARQGMDANARMNAMMNETLNIGGALLVKLFGRANTETARFKERATSVRDIGVQRAVMGMWFFMIIGLLSAVGTALVYGMGGFFAIRGDFTIGTIVAFGSYLSSLYAALQGLANAPVEFATSIVSFERVFEVIDLPLDIKESSSAHMLKNVRGELVFEDVSFNYAIDEQILLSDVRRHGRMDTVTAVLSGQANGEEKETAPRSQARENALEEISFHVLPGQLVALVGPSGAGKTTLTYLIPRLYDPAAGRILLDGIDLREVTLDSLSEQIGMVTQENYLFSRYDPHQPCCTHAWTPARENWKPPAGPPTSTNSSAGWPEGYDTIVGERGYRLSGGEKQRIALARVILKDPRILVLDEATSSLDSESEALIQEALKRVMAGRTSIVIAHRLSTILAADLILVIDRGRIVERGTHQELLAQDGLYAHLYRTQFSRGTDQIPTESATLERSGG